MTDADIRDAELRVIRAAILYALATTPDAVDVDTELRASIANLIEVRDA